MDGKIFQNCSFHLKGSNSVVFLGVTGIPHSLLRKHLPNTQAWKTMVCLSVFSQVKTLSVVNVTSQSVIQTITEVFSLRIYSNGEYVVIMHKRCLWMLSVCHTILEECSEVKIQQI